MEIVDESVAVRIKIMKQYLELMKDVLANGTKRADRTGTGTLSVFGRQSRYDLSEGLPLLTTKKLHLRSIIHELLWFLRGESNINYLKAHNVKIWDEWADSDGNLGPVYGVQWRHWKKQDGSEVDQIAQLIAGIKSNPYGRRHIISAWNVGELEEMALPPCHAFVQFYVSEDKLSCQLYQRSADMFLGVPFNIASYAILTMMVAQVCGLKAGDFIHTLGDAHLYFNHLDQAREQLSRETRPLPVLTLNPEIDNIFEFVFEDFTLSEYHPHPHIKGEVAI